MGYLDRYFTGNQESSELEKMYGEARASMYQQDRQEIHENLNKFVEDTIAYGTFTWEPDKLENERDAFISLQQNKTLEEKSVADDLRNQPYIKLLEPSHIDMMSQNGYVATPYIDLDNSEYGRFELGGVDNWDAEWWQTWLDANSQLGLLGEELPAQWAYTRVQSAGMGEGGHFEEWEKRMGRSSQPTEYEQEAIDYYLLDRSNLKRLVNPATLYRHPPLKNVVNFINQSDEAYSYTTPPNFFSSRRQEGWDGEKALEVFSETNAPLLSVFQAIGGNVQQLKDSPNHYEFRYLINETVHMHSVAARVAIAQKNRGWWERQGNFAIGFVASSLNSVDMLGEVAVAVATAGSSLTYTVGKRGLSTTVKGVNNVKRARRLTGFLGRARSTVTRNRAYRVNDLVEGEDRIAKLVGWVKDTQNVRNFMARINAFIPSNLPDTFIAAGFKKLHGTGTVLGQSKAATIGHYVVSKRALDFATGSVEGFLYGLVNQLDSTEEWSTEALWNEIISEGAGQVFAGPAFRTVLGRGVMMPSHKVARATLTKALDKMKFSPETRSAIDQAFGPLQQNWNKMPVEFQEQMIAAKIMYGINNEGYAMATGRSGATIPSHMHALVNHLSEATGEQVDVNSILNDINKRKREKATEGEELVLSDSEVMIALAHGVLNQLASRNKIIGTVDADGNINPQAESIIREIAIEGMAYEAASTRGFEGMSQAEVYEAVEAAKIDILSSDAEILEKTLVTNLQAYRTVMQKLGLDHQSISTTEGKEAVGAELISGDNLLTLQRELHNANVDMSDTGLSPEQIQQLGEKPPPTPKPMRRNAGRRARMAAAARTAVGAETLTSLPDSKNVVEDEIKPKNQTEVSPEVEPVVPSKAEKIAEGTRETVEKINSSEKNESNKNSIKSELEQKSQEERQRLLEIAQGLQNHSEAAESLRNNNNCT